MSEKNVGGKDLTYKDNMYNLQICTSNQFADGVVSDVDNKTLQLWLSNPEQYKSQLEKYAIYQYITDGDIFQQFDLIRVLPNLDYKIRSLKIGNKNESYILTCRRALKNVQHKELTRDILSQTISAGTICGLWVGKEEKKDKSSPYLILFDDLDYFFPARRVRGQWTVWCDLSYFNDRNTNPYKQDLLNELNPYITEKDIINYQNDKELYRYIEFPLERSICIRTHTLRRNQRFGIPWNTSAIEDIKHKQKIRNLEKVAANKVMNAPIIVTIGLKDSDDSTFKKLGPQMVGDTFSKIKLGLNKNKSDGEFNVLGAPEFVNFSQLEQRADTLNPNKTEAINDDINNATGITRTLTNGKGSNYASAKLNLDIIFNRISELLELIENEVYNKLFAIILPKNVANDYYMEYTKSYPLTNKEKADYLFKLVSMGYSLKPLVSLLGIDFDEYIENSKYEINDLKLREEITPPRTSFTMGSDEEGGREEDEDSQNDKTLQSKENNDSKNPKPDI